MRGCTQFGEQVQFPPLNRRTWPCSVVTKASSWEHSPDDELQVRRGVKDAVQTGIGP